MSLIRRRSRQKLAGTILALFLLANIALLFVNVESVSASPGITSKWTRKLGSNAQTFIQPVAGDINGDGRLEVVVTGGTVDDPVYKGTDGTVTALDGATGTVLWQVSPGGVTRHTPVEIIDLEGDGLMEIVVSGAYPVVLHGADGSLYWKNTAVSSYSLYTPVADVDGDGFCEIFLSSGMGPYVGDDYFTVLSYDGQILRQTNGSWHPCWGGMTIGDTDFDGIFELYQGDRSYSSSGHAWGVSCLDPYTLTRSWYDDDISCPSHAPMLADVDKDGVLDVVVAHQGSNGGLAVLNSDDGSVVTTGGKYRKGLSLGLPSHSQPTISDLDGDGNLEFITSRNTVAKIWDLFEWKLDATLPVVCTEPPTVGDVTGDGKLDIIAITGSTMIIYSYVGGAYVEVDSISTSGNAFTLLADVDNDGYTEVVLTTGLGTVKCFDTDASAPSPSVRSNLQFFSERHVKVAEYVPPPGPEAPQTTALSPVNGATNVPTTLSQLAFRLTDYQHDLMNYSVETDPDIGSGSGSGVSNGEYAVSVSGLAYASTYAWSVTVGDGANSNTETFTFTTGDVPLWYNMNWPFRKAITIDHTQVSGTQSDFPVLVDITSDSFGNAQTDGDDFVFTDTNNVELDHEIELYDSATGQLIAWVSVPSVSSSADTLLYLYYGNPACENQESGAAVWDTGFKLVLHLDEKTGTHHDSTANGNDAAPLNGVIQGATLKIDGGDTFDGVNDYLQVSHISTLTGYSDSFTASFWLSLTDTSRRQAILNKYNSAGDQRAWFIEFQTTTAYGKALSFFVSQDGVGYREYYAPFNPVAGTWYHIAVVWEANAVPKFYINGVQVATKGASVVSSIYSNVGAPLLIGNSYTTGRYLGGSLDEIRMSNPARSASWILTSFNNQYSPAAFYTVGTEQSLPSAPVISDTSPENKAKDVSISLATLSFDLADYQNDLMDYAVTATPNIIVGSGNGTGVGNGRYSVDVSRLQYRTLYTWVVTVFAGSDTTTMTYTFTTENPLLMDSGFSESADSTDLRANSAARDWYESSQNVPTLLYLDQNNVGGNTGKKAGFTASTSGNAYLSQEFSTPQTGSFSVQWGIYVDSITDIYGTDATGWMMIGDDSSPTYTGPNNPAAERFVYMGFYKYGGGTSGTMQLFCRQRGTDTRTTIATLNLDQWYTIRVDVNVAGGNYSVYVNRVLMGTFTSRNVKTSVTHISFAQLSNGAGAFYVDNVYAPAIDTFTIVASAGAGGSVSPVGDVVVAEGSDQVFTITPDTGYVIADVLVDGASQGPATAYTFEDVATDHTITMSFEVET
jgi:ketosteroid isomerase-like protein